MAVITLAIGHYEKFHKAEVGFGCHKAEVGLEFLYLICSLKKESLTFNTLFLESAT